LGSTKIENNILPKNIEKKGLDVLSKKEEKELRQWNRMKSIGKKKYIWLNGMIRWGLFMAISMTVVLQILDDGISLYSLSNQNFMRRLIINLIVFPLGGYVSTTLLWRRYEKRFADKTH
jgi:hypothetical protein